MAGKIKNAAVYTIATAATTLNKSIQADTFIYVVATGAMYYIKEPIKAGTAMTTIIADTSLSTILAA
jgi:hypothetical protein